MPPIRAAGGDGGARQEVFERRNVVLARGAVQFARFPDQRARQPEQTILFLGADALFAVDPWQDAAEPLHEDALADALRPIQPQHGVLVTVQHAPHGTAHPAR